MMNEKGFYVNKTAICGVYTTPQGEVKPFVVPHEPYTTYGVRPSWAIKWFIEDLVRDYMSGLNYTIVREMSVR